MLPWLLVLHIPAIVMWIGGLMIVTLVLAAHSEETGAEARQALTRTEAMIFKKMVHPGAALVVITGIFMMAAYADMFARAPWLHAKLMLVLILVFLDLRVYFRAKMLQSGERQFKRGEWVMSHVGTALLFLGILIFALVKPI